MMESSTSQPKISSPKKSLPTIEIPVEIVSQDQPSQISQLKPKLIPIRSRVKQIVKNKKEIIVEKPKKTKMDLFLEEYVKNNGNGTEAAMKVFDVKNKVNAANIASQYLKKAQNANRLLLEKKGYSQGRMIDVAISKMNAARTPEWWDRLMKMAGYEDFMTKGPVTAQTVNIMEVQKDIIDEYMGDPIIEGETIDE